MFENFTDEDIAVLNFEWMDERFNHYILKYLKKMRFTDNEAFYENISKDRYDSLLKRDGFYGLQVLNIYKHFLMNPQSNIDFFNNFDWDSASDRELRGICQLACMSVYMDMFFNHRTNYEFIRTDGPEILLPYSVLLMIVKAFDDGLISELPDPKLKNINDYLVRLETAKANQANNVFIGYFCVTESLTDYRYKYTEQLESITADLTKCILDLMKKKPIARYYKAMLDEHLKRTGRKDINWIKDTVFKNEYYLDLYNIASEYIQ